MEFYDCEFDSFVGDNFVLSLNDLLLSLNRFYSYYEIFGGAVILGVTYCYGFIREEVLFGYLVGINFFWLTLRERIGFLP